MPAVKRYFVCCINSINTAMGKIKMQNRKNIIFSFLPQELIIL